MPTEYLARTSALLELRTPGSPKISLYLAYGGEPSKIKEALRRACSHRRTIVIAKPEEYVWNVVGQLFRTVPQDCGRIYTRKPPRDHAYFYEIGISGKMPVITWGSEKHSPLTEPFFRWLGSEWRRPTKPREIRKGKAKGGRPSTFRQKHLSLFEPHPDTVAVAQNGDTLGLKDKRKIHVDFTGTIMPNRAFGETLNDLDRALIDAALENAEDLTPENPLERTWEATR